MIDSSAQSQRRSEVGRLAMYSVVLLALVAADGAVAEDWRGIPPGRERLLMTMLGHDQSLPGECRFDGGTNAAFVTAEYACPDGRVTVQLRSPEDAPADALRTQYLAIVVQGGSPPAGLLDALSASVRGHEEELLFSGSAGISAGSLVTILGAASILLLTIGTQVLVDRRWPAGAIVDPRPGGRVEAAVMVFGVAIAVLYFVSRIALLQRLPVFNDEATHIEWARAPFGAYLASELAVGKWIPLQWMALFLRLPLEPLFAARFASVTMGFATLVASVLINRELFSWTAGLVAGAVYVVLPFALLYDRLALADVYVSAFAAWAVWCAVTMHERHGASWGIGLSVCLFAAILSKPTGAVFLAVPLVVGALLVPSGDRASYFRRSLPAMIGGAAFVAFLLAAGYGTQLVIGQSTLHEAGAVGRFVGNLERARDWFVPLFTPVIAAGVSVVAAIALVHGWRNGREAIFLIVLFAISFVPYAMVSSVWYPRYVLFTVVPAVLLVGAAIASVMRWLAEHLPTRSPAAGRIAAGSLAALSTVLVCLAVAPHSVALVVDPLSAGLPAIERSQYISSWSSGYGLPELAAFLRERQSRTPINVAAFAEQGPPNEGIDVYLTPGPLVHRHLVERSPEIAATQISNLARTGRTFFVVNRGADPRLSATPSTYLANATRVWSYARPDGRTTLEVWEIGMPDATGS